MTQNHATDGTPEARAHELYWHSKRGVNAIAEELGLSKSRLYEAVQPLPAGTACPECGRELAYETRTARDRGEPTCPDGCGAEAPSRASTPADRQDEVDLRRVLAGAALGAAACYFLVRLVRR